MPAGCVELRNSVTLFDAFENTLRFQGITNAIIIQQFSMFLGDIEGVRGLKSLGVRDLTYRLAFLACSVTATNPRFGGKDLSSEELTADAIKKQMTAQEWKKIYEMTQDKNLYHN